MPAYKDTKTGKWYCQFYYKDELTGKNKHKVKRGFSRKKDADAWELNFLKSSHFDDKLTMDILIAEYLEHLKIMYELNSIKISTYHTKRTYIDIYITPYFTGYMVSKIKTKDINNWLNLLSRKKSLSSRTLNTAKNILSQIFKFGIVNHNLSLNPVANAESIRFKSNDSRAKYWSVEQYKTFYDSLKTETYRVFFNLLYWSGLRIGEALALTPNDITPYKININKNIVTIKNKEYLTTPKTKTSIRTVEITHSLYYQLSDYISRLYEIQPDDRIFESVHAQAVRTYLYSACQRMNLPKISPHILRHSYASLLYNTSKNILVVSKQIGHKNPAITYAVYSHMLPEEDRKAIDVLEDINTDTIDI